MMELFHFIRPAWLVALPAIMLVWWLVRRRDATQAGIGRFLPPHLSDALTINRNAGGGLRAVDGVAVTAVLLAAAAAGPTWSRQASPWYAETAPVVIAVEVSDSMRANDMQPTRLDRARFKILDLIAERTGSRTALIAYAGSAHTVMPPTIDEQVLKPFLESLDPAIMPAGGANATAVLPLARSLLGEAAESGTLVFVNDGFEAVDIPALSAFAAAPGNPSMAALVVGTDDGGVALMPDGSPVQSESGGRLDTSVDASLLRRAESEGGVTIVRAGPGDADVRRLVRVVASNLRQADDPDAVWRDQGWWLLWPAALLSLLWFRRGWTMQW